MSNLHIRATYAGASLFIWWVVVSAISGALGNAACFLFQFPGMQYNGIWIWLTIGIGQAGALAFFMPRRLSLLWVAASVFGGLGAVLVFWYAVQSMLLGLASPGLDTPIRGTALQGIVLLGVASLLAGCVIGFAQWVALRHFISKAYWWIVATAIGWVIGLVGAGALVDLVILEAIYPHQMAFYWTATLDAAYATGGENLIRSMLAGGVANGVIAAITGMVLLRLLRYSPIYSSNQS